MFDNLNAKELDVLDYALRNYVVELRTEPSGKTLTDEKFTALYRTVKPGRFATYETAAGMLAEVKARKLRRGV